MSGWGTAGPRGLATGGTGPDGPEQRVGLSPTLTMIALCSVLALAGCSLDYEQSRLASEISDDTPDTILYDMSHIVVRDGSPRFRVEAERTETFDERQRQYLTGVRFQELDAEGATVTEGTAEFAEYQTDT
ncbi:MAG: hypothetical protein ACOCY8_02540, partial [Spirochaetota bacterium]